MMIGVVNPRSRSSLQTSSPEMPGSITSRRMTSGRSDIAADDRVAPVRDGCDGEVLPLESDREGEHVRLVVLYDKDLQEIWLVFAADDGRILGRALAHLTSAGILTAGSEGLICPR